MISSLLVLDLLKATILFWIYNKFSGSEDVYILQEMTKCHVSLGDEAKDFDLAIEPGENRFTFFAATQQNGEFVPYEYHFMVFII